MPDRLADKVADESGRRSLSAIRVLEIALVVAAVGLPLLVDHFWVVLATRTLILCLVALSFDVLWGYTGIMSFGQALFYGAAAYGAALMARDLGMTSIFVVVPLCTLIGLVLGGDGLRERNAGSERGGSHDGCWSDHGTTPCRRRTAEPADAFSQGYDTPGRPTISTEVTLYGKATCGCKNFAAAPPD